MQPQPYPPEKLKQFRDELQERIETCIESLEKARTAAPQETLDKNLHEMAQLARALGFESAPVQRTVYHRDSQGLIEPPTPSREPVSWGLYRGRRREVVRAIGYRVNHPNAATPVEVTVTEEPASTSPHAPLPPQQATPWEPLKYALGPWLPALENYSDTAVQRCGEAPGEPGEASPAVSAARPHEEWLVRTAGIVRHHKYAGSILLGLEVKRGPKTRAELYRHILVKLHPALNFDNRAITRAIRVLGTAGLLRNVSDQEGRGYEHGPSWSTFSESREGRALLERHRPGIRRTLTTPD